MEYNKVEVAEIQKTVSAEANFGLPSERSIAMVQLADLELALIGGGIGDPIAA